jgi:hypothetical protein
MRLDSDAYPLTHPIAPSYRDGGNAAIAHCNAASRADGDAHGQRNAHPATRWVAAATANRAITDTPPAATAAANAHGAASASKHHADSSQYPHGTNANNHAHRQPHLAAEGNAHPAAAPHPAARVDAARQANASCRRYSDCALKITNCRST